MPRIDEAGVAAVHVGERAPEPVGVGGHEDDMNVVGHQAVAPDLCTGLRRRLGEKIAVQPVITLFEKGLLAPVAALGHVIRQSG